MIVSASRRTDLPAFYPAWLAARFTAGEVLVRNPYVPGSVRRIQLNPHTVDGIVFWTKNPVPLFPYLDTFASYPYYFQFTLNAYGRDVEPGVPSKGQVLLPAFRWLSDCLGPERMVWRYDPIFFTSRYTPDYHRRYFQTLASRLQGCTHTCVISFLDLYRDTLAGMSGQGLRQTLPEEKRRLAEDLAVIAGRYGIRLCSCAEETVLAGLGIEPARCIDPDRLAAQRGERWNVPRAAGQRAACQCAESVDIGAYDSCKGGCLYCYAGGRAGLAAGQHDPASPLLVGHLEESDRVEDHPMPSCQSGQLTWW